MFARPLPLAIILLAAAAALIGQIGRPAPVDADARIAFRPIRVAADGYATSDTCRACHPAQYETWRQSYHRTMTQVATRDSARIEGGGPIAVAGLEHPIDIAARGEDLFAEFDDPDSAGVSAAPSRITRQLVMTTGSHQQRVFWYRTDHGRVVGQLPAMYLIADRKWIPHRAAFLRPPGAPRSETGRWNVVCIDCHATHGQPGLDGPLDARPISSRQPDTRTAEFGIACEACHGPSARHADANRSLVRRYQLHFAGGPDPTTVQPRRLNPRVGSDVCGQCHSVWGFDSPAARAQAAAAGPAYRPGDALARTRFIAQPSINANSPVLAALVAAYPDFLRESFWSDGMIRVSGREYNGLIDSPCFTKASSDESKMSCFSCHTMHQPSDDPRPTSEWADQHQLAGGMDGNAACLQCHSTFARDVTAHTRHGAGSSGSLCYNCHMPYTTYGLLKGLRSHQVSSPSAAVSVATGRPNACNLCHLDKPLGWTADALQKTYGIASPPLDDDDRRIAASLVWLLRGDAGQRALVAWSFGWAPAQLASRTNWMPPYLSLLLDDPYDAIRYIAARSLRSLPGYGTTPYDFMAPSARRAEDGVRVMQRWRRAEAGRLPTDSSLLFDARGSLRRDAWERLLHLRDDRPLTLAE